MADNVVLVLICTKSKKFGLHRNLKQLLSCSENFDYRYFDSISAVRVIIKLYLFMKFVSILPCSKSHTAGSLSFRNNFAYFVTASKHGGLCSKLFGLSSEWCGEYHSFLKRDLNNDSLKIFSIFFPTSISIDC